MQTRNARAIFETHLERYLPIDKKIWRAVTESCQQMQVYALQGSVEQYILRYHQKVAFHMLPQKCIADINKRN